MKKILLFLFFILFFCGCKTPTKEQNLISINIIKLPDKVEYYQYEEFDYLDYKCPRRGEITELIVTNKTRSKGIGQLLINKMEEYFKSVGCEYIVVDVFAYNEKGIKFYNKKGYHSRMETMIKKI